MIDSARFFELNATLSGRRGKLRPGRYTLKSGMTNGAVDRCADEGPRGAEGGGDRQT